MRYALYPSNALSNEKDDDDERKRRSAACCVVAELKPFANPFGGIGMDRHKKRSNIYIRYFELYDGDTI